MNIDQWVADVTHKIKTMHREELLAKLEEYELIEEEEYGCPSPRNNED